MPARPRAAARLVRLAGEPEIGKTRLADELAHRAREQGAHVLWGRAWQDASAPPYWSWVQVLRALLRSADDATAVRLLGDGAAHYANDAGSHLPELAHHFYQALGVEERVKPPVTRRGLPGRPSRRWPMRRRLASTGWP